MQQCCLWVCAVALLAFHSCKKPETVGLNVLPTGDEAGLYSTDTLTLTAEVVREDSLLTRSDFAAHLAGAVHDPVFGRSAAALYTQLYLSGSSPTFGDNPVCDSVVLALVYSGYYGDTASTHHFTVYEIDEELNKDSSRYSHNQPALKPMPVGSYQVAGVQPEDTVTIEDVSAPQLALWLDPAFGDKILNADAADLASVTTFNNFIKGLYIEDSLVNAGEEGCILYFDLTSVNAALPQSRLIIYYHNDTSTTEQVFELNVNNGAHFNYFTHDYSVSAFGNNFDDPVFGEGSVYIQSMSGVKVRVDIPFYETLEGGGPVAVNKAILDVYVDEMQVTDNFPAHTRLALTGIDSSGLSYFLPDNLDNPVTFGGDLLSGNRFRFNISRYLQQILNGSRVNFGLFLVATGASVNANRTVIGGTKHPSLSMKLSVSYTILN